MNPTAIYTPVANRGKPPVSFINELVAWATKAPAEIFDRNSVENDVYTSVKPELGPWEGIEHRRAVMCEVLRVLAGFESSWRWEEGRDLAANNTTPETEETGIFQVSANSMNFDRSLRKLVVDRLGTDHPKRFITGMKIDHELALEYAARLLRFTVRHNGPVLRREIHCYLRRNAVGEFAALIADSKSATA